LKKFITISLLALYLFNVAGYSLYFNYFIDRSYQQLVQEIDDLDYDQAALTELRIPLHLPYVTGSAGYDRVDGEIELNGIHYNYVKKKIANDTLYLVCLPNYEKTNLSKSKTDYSKGANDLPSEDQNNSAPKKSSFSNEYTGGGLTYVFISPSRNIKVAYCNHNSPLQQVNLSTALRPPSDGC